MTSIGRLRVVLLLVLVLTMAGCKKPKATQAPADEGPSKQDVIKGIGKQLPIVQRTTAGLDLKQIADAYYPSTLTGMSPKKVEDLANDLKPHVVKAIKEGEYVVLWNAPTNASPVAVVAYEKDVPTKGGMVATLGGAATRMTPEEFKAAPKASGR